MKDAMGPDAVSRNHSRATPCSTSAVVTRRKNASIRTSMNRAFPTRERRAEFEEWAKPVSQGAGGLPAQVAGLARARPEPRALSANLEAGRARAARTRA